MKRYIVMALALHIIALVLRLLKRSRLSGSAFVAATLLAAGVVASDWVSSGQPPFSSMHHVMLVLAVSALPAYLVLVTGRGLSWLAPAFPLAGAIPLVLALVFRRDEAWHLAPALQSPWFVPHVIAYMVSYSLALVAFLLLIGGRMRGGDDVLDHVDSGCYEIISVAFPLMSFGMLSGALWANQIWGDYWSWDSKETWSLITWFLYLIYFHCRKHGSIRKYADLAHVLAFLALVTTFLLVNLLPKLASKMHSYV
jgi:ABC-type transport system involved in cytochrome c biogenesis permease subunit